MAWKPAADVFDGGTDAVKALVGKKVRVAKGGLYFGFDGSADTKLKSPVRLSAGTVGFVGHPWQTYIVLAFPADRANSSSTLQQLLRSNTFKAHAVDWDEFKEGFEVDA